MTETEATVKAVREALESTQQREIDRLTDELEGTRAELRDAEGEAEDLRRDLDEAQADLGDREHDHQLADEAIEAAFQSALDVERGIYTLGEHLGQLNALRHGAWADRVPASGTIRS